MRVLITCVIVLSTAAPVAAEDFLTSLYRDQTSAEIRGLTESCAKGVGWALRGPLS